MMIDAFVKLLDGEEMFGKIDSQIEGYYRVIQRTDLSSGELYQKIMTLRDCVACYLFKLSKLEGELKAEYNEAYFIRKISMSKTVQGMRDSGKGVTEAKELAVAENEGKYKEEQTKESLAYRCQALGRSMSKILDAMACRIRGLENELKLIK